MLLDMVVDKIHVRTPIVECKLENRTWRLQNGAQVISQKQSKLRQWFIVWNLFRRRDEILKKLGRATLHQFDLDEVQIAKCFNKVFRFVKLHIYPRKTLIRPNISRCPSPLSARVPNRIAGGKLAARVLVVDPHFGR
mmetsp:Transcript_22177/g.51921  ORF Transcript_22177/g.51921 Transcript_22177/m.51921 type:complete len:137 (+) Transcript_22177:27-437(+)